MHLTITPLLAAAATLATTVVAEQMFVTEYCLTLICRRPARWVNIFGEYNVDASDGCRVPAVPNLEEFCVDTRRERGHFRYRDGPRRCMVVTSSEWQKCSDDFDWATCASEVWTEVLCSW
ncbi:hypothetical protein QBC39DRAFT_368958 [Podospora conica]|nr:hypothetical protein QBC39DRAFT_368958 [Schizothecium conicum]